MLIFKRILIKHMNVLITFVKEGLNETHVDMIANMIDPQKTYKVRMRSKCKLCIKFISLF